MGFLVNRDATLLRNFFKEAAKLRGIQVNYQYPIDMELSNYGEENPIGFSEPVEMDIIFDENPNIRTLKKYGWVTESGGDQPYIANLPYDAKNLCKGCRIIIPSPLLPSGTAVNDRVFVVTDIHSNLEFPEAWACKVAPVFSDKPKPQSVENKIKTSNDNYLKVKL